MKNKRSGISLIVLIVTIIVIIILAAAVILTLSKNNPIERAREAKFKEDIRGFQDELSLTIVKEYTNAGGQRDTKINASSYDDIKNYIPSFSEKYRDKFIIDDDELKYTYKLDDEEKYWCESIYIKSRKYTELEYIEVISNDRTYKVDTNIKLNNSSRVEFKVLFDNIGGGVFFSSGNYGTRDELYVGLEYNEHDHKLGYYNQINAISWIFSKNLTFPNIYTIIMDGRSLIINDTVECNLSKLSYIECNSSCVIMNCNCKYYYFKIYDNNELVRDYIPVLDEENKPALYDKLEEKFYYFEGNGYLLYKLNE